MTWPRLPRLLGPLSVVLFGLAAAGSGLCEIRHGVETGGDIPAIDALFATWDQPGSPGCALAVARGGDLVYSRGYGFANLDYAIPVTPQTVFDVGSVTKQFVAASLTLLATEGKLSLDDDVREWLPELPVYESPITLRHMVHHTSGLRDYLNLFPLAGRDLYYPISHAQILDMMARQQALVFPPGERYLYSNTAYMLLAQVIERASGQSLGDFTRERIFEPLEMNGSRMYDDQQDIIPQRATGYGRDAAGRVRMVHNYNFDVAGDGQLYTTMEDLLRWDHWLHGAQKPAIHAAMLTEGRLANGEPTGYARGLRLSEYRGLRTVGHSGSSWGFLTQLLRFLDPGLSIAISCNADYADPWDLAVQVADHFLADELGPRAQPGESDESPQHEETPPNPPSLTSEQLTQYIGDYFSVELDATYRFSLESGGLLVRIEQEPPLRMQLLEIDVFEIRFDERPYSGQLRARLDFDRGPAGDINGFQLSSGTETGIAFQQRRQ